MIKFLMGIIVILIIIAGGIYVAVIGVGAKDLGIKITPQNSADARTKVGTEIISIKSGDNKTDFTLEGKKDAQFTFDSQELTAHSNNRPWKNYPIKNLQIKILPDGTIESSGILVISKAMPYAIGLGYSENQIKEAMQKYNIPPFEVPIYALGKGSVTNDKVTISASNLKIGSIPIPANIVSEVNKEAEQVLDDLIQKHSNAFHAESLTFSDGKMNFKGQVPEKEYVITE
jgi:hypothetical protein